jgi:hypothetical protein
MEVPNDEMIQNHFICENEIIIAQSGNVTIDFEFDLERRTCMQSHTIEEFSGE